jgi:beta-lactamase class A
MLLAIALMTTVRFVPDPELDRLAESAAKSAVVQFSERDLEAKGLSISVGVMDRATKQVRFGGYRADTPTFPASVVKLFYANYLANEINAGRITHTDEIERATRDMIVDSSNDATGYVVDLLTGTTGGTELFGEHLQEWTDKRRKVDRWYKDRGYVGNNICQKTWGDGPYGRERVSYGPNFENRNALTTFSCLRLWSELATETSLEPVTGISPMAKNWTNWVISFATRVNPADGKSDPQGAEYIGKAVPKGAKLRSKAGWTSTVRHDAAWVTMPDGRDLILVIFTSGRTPATTSAIIPSIAKDLLEAR